MFKSERSGLASEDSSSIFVPLIEIFCFVVNMVNLKSAVLDNNKFCLHFVKIMLSIEISSNTDWITSRWCVEQVKSTLLFLLYQRLQIPVPYPTLKQLVERLKNENPNDDDENRIGSNFFLEKQRSLAIDTFDNVEQLIGILERQVITLENDLEYAAITFGPSPVLSKEVWFIRLPEIDREHKNENHVEYLQRAVGQTIL